MAFDGVIRAINLPDVIQMTCLEGSDRVMTVLSGEYMGRIYFSHGEIVHAVTDRNEGTEAFFEIMAWGNGRFELASGRSKKKTIEMPWNFLLIEGQRQVDERRGGAPEESAEHMRLKILLVDDSRVALNSLKKIIDTIAPGQTILEARNGKDALEVMKQDRPDFVCLDASMPVMDGDVTLMHIMVRSPAPVTLISGIEPSKVEEIMDFLRLGAVDFLKKPAPNEDWKEIEYRLSRLFKVASALKVHQVRRARRPSMYSSKVRPNIDAQGVVIALGGLGGILELQKILVSVLPHQLRRLAFMVIQDMSKALIAPLCTYFDRYSAFRVMPPSNGRRLRAGELYVCNWEFSWHLKDQRFRKSQSAGNGKDVINAFLKECAGQFQDRLMVLALTGMDLDLDEGLETVVSQSGHLLLQSPNTCLYPAPVMRIGALDIDEGHFEADSFQMVLDRFFPI